jgi:hypothetical protein
MQINAGFIVVGNPDYVVVTAGSYEPFDLVPCRLAVDTNGPTCAFLAFTVLGLDPDEISN